jgi:hypothetical protein
MFHATANVDSQGQRDKSSLLPDIAEGWSCSTPGCPQKPIRDGMSNRTVRICPTCRRPMTFDRRTMFHATANVDAQEQRDKSSPSADIAEGWSCSTPECPQKPIRA